LAGTRKDAAVRDNVLDARLGTRNDASPEPLGKRAGIETPRRVMREIPRAYNLATPAGVVVARAGGVPRVADAAIGYLRALGRRCVDLA
jgi:hypothetical protein